MIQAGRFDSTTKTKIKTQHGTLLKVTLYEEDCLPQVEYKIYGVCRQCGGPVGCFCYDESEFSDAFNHAILGMRFGFLCEKTECAIRSEMEINPERVEALIEKYGNDKCSIRDKIYELWSGWDEEPKECNADWGVLG